MQEESQQESVFAEAQMELENLPVLPNENELESLPVLPNENESESLPVLPNESEEVPDSPNEDESEVIEPELDLEKLREDSDTKNQAEESEEVDMMFYKVDSSQMDPS